MVEVVEKETRQLLKGVKFILDKNYDITKQLLEKVKSILKENDKISEILKENFNVFSILHKEHDEDKLHSAFIAELLNPKGSHGMGDTFFKLFKKKVIADKKFKFGKIKYVIREKSVDGRIDIYAEGSGGIIAIENKIYAPDGHKQLERYKKGLEKTNKNHKLLYLTLYGNDASEGSKKELKENEDYFCVSYKDHILKWLELCQKKAAEFPTIRETIKQYINLIKKLTGQLTNQKMSEEIRNLIKKNYREAKAIADNIQQIEKKAIINFIQVIQETLKDKIKEKHGSLDWAISVDKNLIKKWSGINIHHKEWGNGLSVRLQRHDNVDSTISLLERNYYIMICASKKEWDREDIINKLSNNSYIKGREGHFTEEIYDACYHDHLEVGEKMFNEEDRNKLADKIATEMVELAVACKDALIGIKKVG